MRWGSLKILYARYKEPTAHAQRQPESLFAMFTIV